MSLPVDPWYARLLGEALQRPVYCTIWLALVLAAAVGLAYVAGPWMSVALGLGGISSLAARLVNRADHRAGTDPSLGGLADPSAVGG
jgi:hypothetical protein